MHRRCFGIRTSSTGFTTVPCTFRLDWNPAFADRYSVPWLSEIMATAKCCLPAILPRNGRASITPPFPLTGIGGPGAAATQPPRNIWQWTASHAATSKAIGNGCAAPPCWETKRRLLNSASSQHDCRTYDCVRSTASALPINVAAIAASRCGEGGSRNDPQRIRCGCFLPDLTGLAKTASARLPRRIWRRRGGNARRGTVSFVIPAKAGISPSRQNAPARLRPSPG